MSGSKFLSTLKKAAIVAGDVLTTKGDILSRSSSALGRLGVGSNGKVLTAKSSEALGISWETPVDENPNTTKGDLSGFSDEIARVPIGANFKTLQAKSGVDLGLSWEPSSTSVLTTAGDLLYASSANTLARLAKGTDNQILTMNGSNINWEAAAGGANTFLVGTAGEETTGAGTTEYIPAFGNHVATSSEGNANYIAPMAFTWSRLTVQSVYTAATANSTFKSRVNGSGNQTVTIGAGATGIFSDNSNTDSCPLTIK